MEGGGGGGRWSLLLLYSDTLRDQPFNWTSNGTQSENRTMCSILCTIPFYKSHFPHAQLFCTHPVVKVLCQKVCLCQNVQQLYKINSHRSWTPFIVQESISIPHNYLKSTLPPTYLHLHHNSLTSNQLQDFKYSIERIDNGVPAYIYVYFLILQNIYKLLFTLYSLLIQNLAIVKISCPYLLVKEQGLSLYSDPTPIYLFVYPIIIPQTTVDWKCYYQFFTMMTLIKNHVIF